MIQAPSPHESLMLKAAQDEVFRQALLKNPKETLEAHLGTTLPESFKVNVVENTPEAITIVLPPRMDDALSDEELDAVAGGDANRTTADILFSMSTYGVGCIMSMARSSLQKCRASFGLSLWNNGESVETT